MLAALLLLAAATQDPAERLQKRVAECSRHITDRFVFFGGGSGVIISAEGHCLTNHHVVARSARPARGREEPSVPEGEAAREMRVTLHSGKVYPAKLLCTDVKGDIALYKLQGGEGEKFPFVEFADSDRLEPGQYVVACGNPFNLAGPAQDLRWYPSITLGIVSALHRNQGFYFDCIQTDAAVNPGNSGGPLVTLDGKLAGINGRIATRYFNRVNSGVGFAIPANQIRNFLPEMMKGGVDAKIHHGQVTGLRLEETREGRGAPVTDVRRGSTADQAGFQKDDLIVGVNGYPVFNRWRFLGVLGTYPMGTEVSVRVRRGAAEKDLKVVLDLFGEGEVAERPKGSGYLGITVEDTTKEGGLQVTLVTPGSPAEDAGIREGDAILKLDGQAVSRRQDFVTRLWRKRPQDKIRLLVRRGDAEVELEVQLGKHPDD